MGLAIGNGQYGRGWTLGQVLSKRQHVPNLSRMLALLPVTSLSLFLFLMIPQEGQRVWEGLYHTQPFSPGGQPLTSHSAHSKSNQTSL